MSVKPQAMGDAMMRMIGSFKQFEKKLDKLQEDVTNHGQTLSELRKLVSIFSINSLGNAFGIKSGSKGKGLTLTTTAIQSDNKNDDPTMMKRKRMNAVRPLPSKMKSKIIANEKAHHKTRLAPNTKQYPGKLSTKIIRQSKGEVQRKSVVPQKPVDKTKPIKTNK